MKLDTSLNFASVFCIVLMVVSFNRDVAAWQAVVGSTKIASHSTSPLYVSFSSPTVTDAHGNQYRSVVCIDNICNHFAQAAEVKMFQTAKVGYQAFFGDINEPGTATKFQGLPIYSPKGTGLSVTHKKFKTTINDTVEPDWIFTEFGGYSKISKTNGWRTNGSTLGLDLSVYNNPDFYGPMPVRPVKLP